jgi:hypothetical protein
MSASTSPAITDQVPRKELHLLLTLLTSMLSSAISRTGGIRLANQFEQQLNHYIKQKGWDISISMSDLKRGPSDMEVGTLLTAYRSSAQYALALAKQILGRRLLDSTLAELQESLTPQLCQVNDQYQLFRF